MKNNTSFAAIVIFLIIACLILSPANSMKEQTAFQTSAPKDQTSADPEIQTRIPQSIVMKKPVRLCIPSVHLSTSIIPIHLSADGQLQVPKSSEVAGLYVDGVLPGENGNAIVAGHVDNYTGPAIFYPLKHLKPGSFVLLFDQNNQYLKYEVLAVQSYYTQEAPLDKIFGDTPEKQLNLITCTGKYDRKKKEHEKRLIVYTRLVE
ncbi:class F sortase [Paenibacillus sp. OK076]|uniref:class F sortase n=1 Tax=Paenibacillus sp. OK076 TaxID=1884379 RepID=UPI0008CA7F94|nr:class F sortase [Paenibacillus sp. OK076]SEN16419.1 LPXTG-site transpeptidase (sortase) family protein [Paenibacillus sp. OK076]